MAAFFIEQLNQKDAYEKINFPKLNFKGGLFLQAWDWGSFMKKIGNRVMRISIKNKNKKIVGKALLIIKKIGPFFSYAYCPYGPVLDYQNLKKAEIILIFRAIQKFCKQLNCFSFRFNPPLSKNEFSFPAEEIGWQLSQARTKQPEKTLYLSLEKSSQKLLEEMKAKTRYNIRLAGRKKISLSRENSPEALNAFLKLVKETAKRNEFTAYPKEYYQKMISVFQKNNFLKIYTASYKNKPLATILIIYYKDTATYLHGASSNNFRNLMAPYLLQWEAIVDAKKKNLHYYDFWGIDEKKWPGVTRFKMGFGGTRAEFQPTYEMPVQKIKYFLFSKIRFLLKK